jgi:hypothetical protein
LALALLGLCTVPVSGEGDVLEFDAYRMVQYDRNGEELGSRSSALSNLAVPAGVKGNLGRKAVVLDFDKVTTELLDELLDQRAAGGLVIVLPADLSSVSSEARAKWSAIEQALAEKQVARPRTLPHPPHTRRPHMFPPPAPARSPPATPRSAEPRPHLGVVNPHPKSYMQR